MLSISETRTVWGPGPIKLNINGRSDKKVQATLAMVYNILPMLYPSWNV